VDPIFDGDVMPSTNNLATPGKRFLGRMIDTIILVVGLIALGIAGLIDFSEGATNFGFTVVAVLLAAAYEIVFVATRGQTPGKMAVGTRVVTETGDDPPGWGPALIRYAVPGVVGVIPGLGLLGILIYLWLLWDNKRQGLHDKAAKTLVINA